MTFRQAVTVVWRQRLLILVVILLAIAGAAIFLARQTPVYTSAITVRMNALAASAAANGQIGTDTVDFSPESVTSASVLEGAAKLTHEPASAAGSWDVGFSVDSGSGSNDAMVLTITANGTSAEQAKEHVEAIERSYNTYLANQTAQARKTAEAQAAKWTATAQADQEVVDQNPSNSIAQSNLATAISSLQSANDTISKIDTAGEPLIVTVAAAPGEFQGTSPLIAIAVALAAGLVAGIGIALVWDAFDDRVRPEDDLETLTGVPALGELSLDNAVRQGRDRLPVAGRARTTLNEGLRSLRTTLQVLLPSDGGTLVVTSVEPGDGKTFVSSNLALAWARMGKQVVLIGGDLRNAGLENYFGEAAMGPGLTELLQAAASVDAASSRADVVDALNETSYPGLSILPSGDEPWDPADLLALDALGDVIASLREHCDVVIVDSPPSLELADGRLLAAHSDGVVVVASMRRTRRQPLAETVHALTASEVPVLGIVMNRSRRRMPKSYSAYYGPDRRRPTAREEPAATREEPLADAELDADEAIEASTPSEDEKV